MASHRPRGPRTAPIPSKISSKLQRRIIEAKEHLAISEQELEAALRDLKVEERADKRMISQRLERAFEKLAAGRRHLDEVLIEED